MPSDSKAQALLIIEQIYLDIHLASQPKNENSTDCSSATPNIFMDTAERILKSVSEAMMRQEDPCSMQLQRLIDLGKSLGWMMLSICSHSTHFVDAANDNDKLWQELYTLIGSNAISIELFAKTRRLSWHPILPRALRPGEGGKLTVNSWEPYYPYVIKLDACAIYHPKYYGLKQQNITKSVYMITERFDPSQNLRRQPSDGNCAMCGSPQLCACNIQLADETNPLLELREYPDRGVGVRQYVGEIREPAARKGTTYALHHTLRDRSIGVIDAAIYGNWTRYMNHSCRAGVIFVSAVEGCRYKEEAEVGARERVKEDLKGEDVRRSYVNLDTTPIRKISYDSERREGGHVRDKKLGISQS
ncbi:predicted protein [Histoplasma mississippiense (nom. inval.)]|uniref:predicted protein n=1 Tax=Ajellomyces capsulatus (strain NAm1 / WU24) TaxID=2059318 RepID=UPI000157C62D|nr:predicted protein [Histoplasma mississippiense (nom. inval.)]EDN08596.1 predicted protein [Histoplasma mississippiense (nom. inval.)]